MGKASDSAVKKANGSKKVKANAIVNLKENKDEYLKVLVQGQKEPLFLPFDANKNVLFKDLRARLSGASYLTLKKNSETLICDVKDGVIEQPGVGWDYGRVWVVFEPKPLKPVPDKASLKRKKMLSQLAPVNRLPVHLNQIWKVFKVSNWEELFASPRFSATFACNVAKFIQYRNAVIQLFTPIILRQGPEGFDLFTMFRISEGDHRVCDVLKELLKGSRDCNCCNKEFADELEALRHYFDLEHAFKSRKMFDEPVYVSAILETAREYGIFLPIQEFQCDDTDEPRKKTPSESTASPASSKALRRVKAEVVDLISPPESPRSNSNSVVRQDLPSISTPSPVEAEEPREPSPLPPPAPLQPQAAPLPPPVVNGWQQQPPIYRLDYNRYTPVVQPPPGLPVNHGYGVNPAAHPVPNANYGDPNVTHQIPNMTLPPPSVPSFYFAPPPSGPPNGMPPINFYNAPLATRAQQPGPLITSLRQRQESEAVVPLVQSAHPRHDKHELESPRPSRRRQESEPLDSQPTQPSKRVTPATPPPPKKLKAATQNANIEPISKVPAPVEVKPAPSRAQHIIFSSDDEEEVAPPPQPSKPSMPTRPGWKKVLSSSSESSDSEDPSVPYRQHLAKKAPAPAKPASKPAKATPKSPPAPPPAKKARTTSTTSASEAATPPAKKKAASKSKQKSKDPPPVVDMKSDSEASEATVPEPRTGKKQPSMRPDMVPYEDFTPEYKCDLTTPIVTMDTVLQHFKVSNEGALYKLTAFKMPVIIPNSAEFIDYRRFVLRNMRSFCIKQRADFPFVFYMFKALKSENIYLADIDRSYAMNCKKCDNSPLTLDHLFSRGHIMMFSKTRLEELQIGIDYIREQLRSTTGVNSTEFNIDPFNPAFLHLLKIYNAPTINELCSKPGFRSTLLPEKEVNRFRTEIIQAIVNTNSPNLPFILLPTFSIDKLIYLRDHVASNLSVRVRCGQEGTLCCRCGKTLKGYLYVVHVLKENHLNQSAFETLKNIMDDMFVKQVDNPYGPPTMGYTTIENLSNCPNAELNRVLRSLRRNRDRNDANAVVNHLNDKITAIEAELLRRGYHNP